MHKSDTWQEIKYWKLLTSTPLDPKIRQMGNIPVVVQPSPRSTTHTPCIHLIKLIYRNKVRAPRPKFLYKFLYFNLNISNSCEIWSINEGLIFSEELYSFTYGTFLLNYIPLLMEPVCGTIYSFTYGTF